MDGRARVTTSEEQVLLLLKRDEIAQIGWLSGGENFVSKRDQFTVKFRYNVLLGTKQNPYGVGKVRYNQQGRKKCQCIKRSQIHKSCTHGHVTMNTVVQINQCNRSF